MTGQEFRDYVVQNFKRDDKDDEIYEHTTDVVMEMEVRLLSQDKLFEAYTTGISGTNDFILPLPSDFGHIIGNILINDPATNQEYSPIIRVSKINFDLMGDDRVHDNPNTGVPRIYTVFSDQVYLYPVPDKDSYEYQITYTTRTTTDIVAGTASVPFTDKYRWIVRAGVLSHLHYGMDNFQEGQLWDQKYNIGLRDIQNNDNRSSQGFEPMRYSGV